MSEVEKVEIAPNQLWKFTEPICDLSSKNGMDACREIIQVIEIVKLKKVKIWDCIILVNTDKQENKDIPQEGEHIDKFEEQLHSDYEYVSPGYPSKEYNTWHLERPIDRDADGAKKRRDNKQNKQKPFPTDSSNFVEGPCAKIVNELEIWHDYDIPIKIGGVLAKTELKDIDNVRYLEDSKKLKPIPLVWETVATELVINPNEFFAKAKYIDPEYYNNKRAQQALHEGVCVVEEEKEEKKEEKKEKKPGLLSRFWKNKNANLKFEYKYNFKF